MATEHPKITAYIPKEILQALDNWKENCDIKSRSEAIVRILENYLEVPHKVPQQGTANLEAVLSAVLNEVSQLKDRVAALEESISTASLATPSTALAGSSDVDMSNVLGKASNTALAEGTELSDEALSTVPLTVPNPLESQPLTISHESNSSNVPVEALSTALAGFGNAHRGDVLSEVPGTALVESTGRSDDAFSTAPGTAPNPLAPQSPTPLTQSALAKRLGCSDKAVEKHRKQGDKEGFAEWSRDRDPDNLAWTWQGTGGRGQPLRFLPRN